MKGERIMLKKTMTYEDYNGNERTEDFYFNLTKAEIMQMELSESGGFSELLKKIVAGQDTPNLAKIFKEIILAAYGEKSLDGKRFMKNKEISEAFEQTQAFSDLYMELISDEKKASDFINSLIPASLSKDIAKMEANTGNVAELPLPDKTD